VVTVPLLVVTTAVTVTGPVPTVHGLELPTVNEADPVTGPPALWTWSPLALLACTTIDTEGASVATVTVTTS
jgi:hypothetical protein